MADYQFEYPTTQDDKYLTNTDGESGYGKTTDAVKGYGNSKEFPKSGDKKFAGVQKEQEQKKQNGFVRFLKFVFVKNIGLKLLALLTAGAMWLIIAGFGTPVNSDDDDETPAQQSTQIIQTINDEDLK